MQQHRMNRIWAGPGSSDKLQKKKKKKERKKKRKEKKRKDIKLQQTLTRVVVLATTIVEVRRRIVLN